MKKQAGIGKGQHKVFKDQMNAINDNNRKDDVKKEDGEVEVMDHSYIGNEYKDLIDNIFESRLSNGDLCLT